MLSYNTLDIRQYDWLAYQALLLCRLYMMLRRQEHRLHPQAHPRPRPLLVLQPCQMLTVPTTPPATTPWCGTRSWSTCSPTISLGCCGPTSSLWALGRTLAVYPLGPCLFSFAVGYASLW